MLPFPGQTIFMQLQHLLLFLYGRGGSIVSRDVKVPVGRAWHPKPGYEASAHSALKRKSLILLAVPIIQNPATVS